MSHNLSKPKHSDLSSWIGPCILLLVFPPLGVLLVVLKLLGGTKRVRVDSRHPYNLQQQGQAPVGAKTTAPASAKAAAQAGSDSARLLLDQMAKLAAKGKRLVTVGTVISVLFSIALLGNLSDISYWLIHGELRYFLTDLLETIPLFTFLGGGLGCLWAGLRKGKQVRRYRNYLAMIGRRKSISISSLASTTGLTAAKVRDDLEDMLGLGLFPTGFLDYGGDMLVLSEDGLEYESPAQSDTTPQEMEHALLTELRAVNNVVANEKLSAQIDRIGVITAKILEYQKNRPETAPQLHSFLSYYLPTTLKILRAYGQLEEQTIAGENITAAMARIEGMMDKVVEGFEKQLDQLFQGDVMDITTDVEVLERMLAKDGLSHDQGMTLGI